MRKHDGELETGGKKSTSAASPWVKRSLRTVGFTCPPPPDPPFVHHKHICRGSKGVQALRVPGAGLWARSSIGGRQVKRHRPPIGRINCCCGGKPTRHKWIK